MPNPPPNIIVRGNPLEACLTAIVLKVQLGNALNVCLELKPSNSSSCPTSIQASHCDARTASQLQKMGVDLRQLLKSGDAEFALGINHRHINSTKNVFLPFGHYGATIHKKPFYLSYLEHVKNLDPPHSINDYSLAYQLAHANNMGFSSDQSSPLCELEYCYTLKHDAITPTLIAYAQSLGIHALDKKYKHNIDLIILAEGLGDIDIMHKRTDSTCLKNHISLQHAESSVTYSIVTGSSEHIHMLNTPSEKAPTYQQSSYGDTKVLHLKNSHLGLFSQAGFISTHINISTLVANNILINNDTIQIPTIQLEHEQLRIHTADIFMYSAIAYLFNQATIANPKTTTAIEHALKLFEDSVQISHVIPPHIKSYWPYFCILVSEQKAQSLPTPSHPISVPIQYTERIKHIFRQTTVQCANYKNFKQHLVGIL